LIPPSSLQQETLYAAKYPDGKLFRTISNGSRKMPGYSGQIKTRDRWAIVAYVRALQLSQNASIDQISEAQRETILSQQSEIQKALKEKADADEKAAQEKEEKAAKESA